MTKFLFAILTTLFVSVMPLQAAYADECKTTLSRFFADGPAVKAQGGDYTVIDKPEAVAKFLRNLNEIFSDLPSIDTDTIVVSFAKKGAQVGAVSFSKDGCLILQGLVPSPVVPYLLGDKPLIESPKNRDESL